MSITPQLQSLKFGTDVWDPTHRYETSWLLTPVQFFLFRMMLVSNAPSPRRRCLM